MVAHHSWKRYVAIGDSFTEGIGDPEPKSPGGFRGWADRVAEVLSAQTDEFAYANLAVRGKLMQQIFDDQLEPALALGPDLITISAGGNNILRPGSDPDRVADRLDQAVARLRSDGATVLVFTGPDVGSTPVLGRVRGKAAIFNENVRALAARNGALVGDMWALRELSDPRMWAPDRLHFSAVGHNTIARMVLNTLGVPNELQPFDPEPMSAIPWRQARAEDMTWARTHFAPWVVRRLRGRSSGDNIQPKRPTFTS
ncbi:MAG TPA: SGNH/GDSL hydrolase family protein [Galbitalea sp.]|jgi:lysophospholipase L1-like esterase|nr:SGNH/GDSL hydrolase family protein [Galbitalea sp.]